MGIIDVGTLVSQGIEDRNAIDGEKRTRWLGLDRPTPKLHDFDYCEEVWSINGPCGPDVWETERARRASGVSHTSRHVDYEVFGLFGRRLMIVHRPRFMLEWDVVVWFV